MKLHLGPSDPLHLIAYQSVTAPTELPVSVWSLSPNSRQLPTHTLPVHLYVSYAPYHLKTWNSLFAHY